MVAVVVDPEEDQDQEFDWRLFAACSFLSDEDQEQSPFFIEGYGAQYNRARRYCHSCPVVIDCLIEGLENEVGMWGCTSPNERTSVNNMMEYGMSFKKAVESIWELYRHENSGILVPPKSIWKDWDA